MTFAWHEGSFRRWNKPSFIDIFFFRCLAGLRSSSPEATRLFLGKEDPSSPFSSIPSETPESSSDGFGFRSLRVDEKAEGRVAVPENSGLDPRSEGRGKVSAVDGICEREGDKILVLDNFLMVGTSGKGFVEDEVCFCVVLYPAGSPPYEFIRPSFFTRGKPVQSFTNLTIKVERRGP